MTRCGKCHQPSDVFLCTNCTIALRIELDDVASLLADLEITRSRQDQLLGPYGNGPSGSENPLPFKTHITEIVWILHNTLASWADTTLAPPSRPAHHTASLARWLRRHLDDIRLHPDAGQLADEVTSAIHQARRAIDRPDDHRQFLGPCGAQLPDHTYCLEEVYGVEWIQTTHCPACNTVHNIADRQKWLLDVAQDRLGTSTEIAGYLRTAGVRCTPGQIRGYVARGRLTATETSPPLYRMADVLGAIQDRYQRHRVRPVA
jgi:hypothetical protein